MQPYTAERKAWRALEVRCAARLAPGRTMLARAARGVSEAAAALAHARLALAAAEREAAGAAAARRSTLGNGHTLRGADFDRLRDQASACSRRLDALRLALTLAQTRYDDAHTLSAQARRSYAALARKREKYRLVDDLLRGRLDDNAN
ncbi:hypothetical protein WKR88_18025 [Trinickia caryophylli]|uniref:Uncharacterized protein n=1 Tax=Trinickia caryophylli TaxID=28094 RepID=A0A1X7DZI6_TRICW|nr:hypothetical protein [Trinickia caryophylli]PMS14113.1 hypothetical protein C0Z17_00810 [Trinickia caryophylli]TRX17812.1 hypothetical protein FNF07_05950 [Trinickia caryophylli]WQE11420.1 hypothetical protein U0034_16965 [Trinickia caryophylli]SMF24415.1 hypothetical protein SAMN06295900_104278 [Trinickia caryophylli]GLU32584.1 hypothetical protein Busp01_24260 [Trinickia caryophylli]